MPNFKSFLEKTVHPRLQYLTHFRAPIPLSATLVAFSRIQIVGGTQAASLSTLATTLGEILACLNTPESALLPNFTSLFHIFTHALHTACLRMRIQAQLPIQLRDMFHRCRASRSPSDDTYATARAEARYWRVAGRYHQRLYGGNETRTSTPSMFPIPSLEKDTNTVIQLVTYYTPRLLPVYRGRNSSGNGYTSRKADASTQMGRISPRLFCKWHRMVFQEACHHPTLAQAAKQIKYYSSRDFREMQRIARMLPDDLVFGPKGKCSGRSEDAMRYRKMWQHWLENKGMDLVIVFE